MPKLKPRALGRPALLRPAAEIEAEKERLRASFLEWFEKVPGAEWEVASTCGMLLYCRWYANPERPEWGKAFCAYRLGSSLDAFKKQVSSASFPSTAVTAPLDWDHWDYFGLSAKTATREEVNDRYHEKSRAQPTELRIIDISHQRCISDVYYRDLGK